MFLKQLWFYTIFKVAFYYFLYNAKVFSITIFSWWFSWFFRIANVYQCCFILNILCDDSILLNQKVGIRWFIHWLPSMPFHHGLFVNLINKQILYCLELVLQILLNSCSWCGAFLVKRLIKGSAYSKSWLKWQKMAKNWFQLNYFSS